MYIIRKKPKRGQYYDLVNDLIVFPALMTKDQFYAFRKRNILYIRKFDLYDRLLLKRFLYGLIDIDDKTDYILSLRVNKEAQDMIRRCIKQSYKPDDTTVIFKCFDAME